MTRELIAAAGPQRLAEIPLCRFGRPYDVAGVIAFLRSDLSSYMTKARAHRRRRGDQRVITQASKSVEVQRVKLNLETYVPGLLLPLSNKVSASASQVYRERFGITVTDWRLLSFFKLYPWATAAQACDFMGLDKGAVSRATVTLIKSTWIESRPQGLRKIEYRVTPAGDRLHDEVYAVAMAREKALLRGFSAAERNELVRMLKQMLANLDAIRGLGRLPRD